MLLIILGFAALIGLGYVLSASLAARLGWNFEFAFRLVVLFLAAAAIWLIGRIRRAYRTITGRIDWSQPPQNIDGGYGPHPKPPAHLLPPGYKEPR